MHSLTKYNAREPTNINGSVCLKEEIYHAGQKTVQDLSDICCGYKN